MQYIDLHVHTAASDGTKTPEETVRYAMDKGLSAIAITDHDTVQGLPGALKEAEKFNFNLIPGIELTADYEGEEIHILGYNIDHTDRNLLESLVSINLEKKERNEKMYAQLNKAGIVITPVLMQIRYPDAIITRGHIADYLVSRGYVEDTQEAFSKFLGKTTPFFVPRDNIPAEFAIRLILQSGGIPVLAHPLLYYDKNSDKLYRMTRSLKSMGLKGIEAIYPSHKGRAEGDMRRLAAHFGLFITGGSDYHGGLKKGLDMGSGYGNLKVPADLLKNLI
ncbi:PHP domain-containing protein [Parasporobacterium paucivorans]|uniref:Polymerase/histidinol phosphatase N-terminal domain-containing protein n=1 Tax=Parasporobacterium paucivorans DSM 15970 TaxID=1122934 RepID=A0A1M6AJQ3_9FIRM|nr:PHP domain-containing protein [Parasporobacterium paucivorans]SHI36710.1 hypothetical protein SAMN02745691_00187 [Parasporobacterium paucivorans DSM 15970]